MQGRRDLGILEQTEIGGWPQPLSGNGVAG